METGPGVGQNKPVIEPDPEHNFSKLEKNYQTTKSNHTPDHQQVKRYSDLFMYNKV